MPKIGTTQTQRAQTTGGSVLEDQHSIEKGDNLFRFIQGPQMIKTIFYPTVIEEDENGKTILKSGFRALNFLDKSGLIESIQSAEIEIRGKLGDEDEIGFKDKINWFYLAIDLQQSILSVKPLKVPKTVKDKINEIETKLDIKDPAFLMNGLFWMFDILVSKTITPGKAARYGTKYDASIYGENPWRSRIPAVYLRSETGTLIEECGGMGAIFAAELIPLIEDCDIDLEKALAPQSEIQIRERLQKFPINLLGRRTNDHTLIYPQHPQFGEMLKSLGLPTVEIDAIEGNQSKEKPAVTTSGSRGIGSLKAATLKKQEETVALVEVVTPVETVTPEPTPITTESKIPPMPKPIRGSTTPTIKPVTKLKNIKGNESKGSKW
jgi:hypothetical protein